MSGHAGTRLACTFDPLLAVETLDVVLAERQGEFYSDTRWALAWFEHFGTDGEVASDLAYRLYNPCETKKQASEALAYNRLVISWPEIGAGAGRRPAG